MRYVTSFESLVNVGVGFCSQLWPLYRIDERKQGKQLMMDVCDDEDGGSSRKEAAGRLSKVGTESCYQHVTGGRPKKGGVLVVTTYHLRYM